ncbi:hypothetical protein GCM10009549_54860 [Streptomyces thermoalcalitolerans]|uniref:Uncharacterized protein n=1 Tax=Streptomyces thermoalcalitolerans TaxID=65605 RepID=A0ABN1PPI6_9ACTN
MAAVVRHMVGVLVSRPDHFRVGVQKNGGLDFPRVHVGEQRGAHPGPLEGRLPVLHGREQRDALTTRGGLLNHVAQHVVSAVSVDDHQGLDTGTAQ